MPTLRLMLALALTGGGFLAGWRAHGWKDAAAAAKAEVHAIHVVQTQAAVAQKVAVRQQAAQDRVRVVTRTITKEIPAYVTLEADAGCVVPDGFRRLHDAAAAGVLPAAEPPGKSADAPSGLALSAVADTVSRNYGICHETAERLKGWQDWWAGVSAAR
jgi:hypothetical protein